MSATARTRGPRRVGLLLAPLALALLGTQLGATDAALVDTATARSEVHAVPTLWWAAGDDAQGRFGDGTVDAGSPTAQRVSWRPGLAVARSDRVERMAAGRTSACAVIAGRAWCWGDNSHGQLGDGGSTASADPVAVATTPEAGSALPAGVPVTDISVGNGTACAVAGGDVYCWGDNSSGQLGHGSPGASSVPVAVATTGTAGSALPAGVATRVVTGGGGAGSPTSFSCALAAARAYCWGSRQDGMLGDGVPSLTPSLAPVGVRPDAWGWSTPVEDIAIGRTSACAMADARAYCWGRGDLGLLGNDVHDPEHDQTIPLAVSGEGSLPSAPLVSTVAVGASSACAVHDGDVHCWGANVAGQLGADDPEHTDAGTTEVQPPVRVARVGTGESQLAIDARVDELAVGAGVSGADSWCSLSQRPTALPQVHCWGGDTHGQLGLGATGDRRVPRLLLAHPASGLPSGVEVGGITAGADLTMLWAAP